MCTLPHLCTHYLSPLLSPLPSRGQLHGGSTCLDTGQSFLKESIQQPPRASHPNFVMPSWAYSSLDPFPEAPGSACKVPYEDICTSKPDLIGGYSSHLCYSSPIFPPMMSHSFTHQASFMEGPPTGRGPLATSLPGFTPYTLHNFNLIAQKHSPRGWSWLQPPTWNSCRCWFPTPVPPQREKSLAQLWALSPHFLSPRL